MRHPGWRLHGCRPWAGSATILTPLVLGVDASLTRTAIASAGGDGFRHLAVQTSSGTPIERRLRYLADAIYEAVTQWPGGPAAVVVLEEPGFIPTHQSVQSVYAMGRAQGAILAGLPDGLPVRVVMVSQWRRDLEIHIPKGAGKAPIVAFVEQQGIVLPYSPRSRTPDHDVADAYCLAMWGARLLRGGAR